jgi:O-antigen/teichoic acid export membrane protein
LRGIVLSLVLCGWSVAIIHLYFSVRIIPYKVKLFSHQVLAEGLPIIRIGLPYVLAAAALAVTTGEVYSYINDASQIGLYRSGFALMVAYSGIIFKAVEADYFPRLSGVNHDTLRLNHTINQQIDVCVLLMAPMLILFILVIPLAIRILYSSEFLPVIPMVVASIFHLLIKAITTPISYTPLAKADTWLYLIMECSYYLIFLLMIRYGIDQYGLIGAGWAMSFASVFELIILLGVYCPIYGYKMRRSTILLIVPQALLLIATVALCLLASNVIKYSVGSVSLLLSLLFSWRRLSPQLAVVQRINGYVLATTRTLKRIFGFRS